MSASGRKRKKKGKGGGRIVLFVAAASAFLAVVAVLAAAAAVKITESGLPPVPTWQQYADRAPKVSRILASDGSVIHEVFTERRTLVDPDAMPPLLVNAVLAAEDAEFMKHEGLSYMGIARAMLTNLWKGRIAQGGSTITQQVVKQVMLSPERTWQRKFRELLLARLFEISLTKNEILAMYMSQIYLGHGRYGFEEAARFLFAKSAAALELEEAALLAGLVSAPEGNSVLNNPEGAIFRQHYVLDRMADLGMITREQALAAARNRLKVWGKDEPAIGLAPYFADAVQRELKKLVGPDRIERGGLTVSTTVDPGVSAAAEAALSEGLAELYRQGRRRLVDEKSVRSGGIDNGLEDDMPPPPETVVAKVESCRRDKGLAYVSAGGKLKVLSEESLARLGPDRDSRFEGLCVRREDVVISKGVGTVETDRGKIEEVNGEFGPQAVFVALDTKTRAVRALIGGEDYRTRRFNRAVQSKRPIGSTVKPFIYTAALMAGVPADRGWVNEPVAFRGAGGKMWRPKNYGDSYDGIAYDMAGALKHSINVIAVKVLQETGVDKVAALLESLGFRGSIPRDLSMALGSVEASPLELANAFATFGSDGRFDSPYLISSITDFRGNRVFEHEARPGRAIPSSTAAAIRKMLRGVVTGGTASALADMPVQVWGKTGTTNMSREAWFVGGFNNVTAVVSVAYDDRLSMKGATGGNTAVPLFAKFIEHMESASGSRK